VAQLILDTDDAELEINTRKIKVRHLGELSKAAICGTLTLGSRLSLMLLTIRKRIKADAAEIESVDSLVSSIATKAPNISLDLLSARVQIEKELGLGSSAVSGKGSILEPIVTQAARTILQFVPQARALTGDHSRWEPPVLAIELPDSAKVNVIYKDANPIEKLKEDQVWGAHANLQ
jgi:hypothetical protein